MNENDDDRQYLFAYTTLQCPITAPPLMPDIISLSPRLTFKTCVCTLFIVENQTQSRSPPAG